MMVPAQEATRLTWARSHLPSCGRTSRSQERTDSEIFIAQASLLRVPAAGGALVETTASLPGVAGTEVETVFVPRREGKKRSLHSSMKGRRDIQSETSF